MAAARSRRDKKGSEKVSDVDFKEKESRLTFIQERLDSLLDEFGQTYGSFLAEELQKRLDYTVQVFHEDASLLLTEMAKQSNAQMEMSGKLREGEKLEDLIGSPAARTGSTNAVEQKEEEDGVTLRVGTDRVKSTQRLFVKKNDY